VSAVLFPRLFDEAERARWRMEELPWSALRADVVTPELKALVREIVISEATTFSATQRFLQEFADDVDFTSWISVWFYEETKHPQVLLRWLARVGASVDEAVVRRARVTTPFMKSKVATLAAARYVGLAERSPEPLLGAIARRLAGDEARHAASFFSFARARLAASPSAAQDRRDALKVLHVWSADRSHVSHPVHLFQGAIGFDAVRSRVFHLIGLLVDAPLRTADDVLRELRDTPQGELHGTA